MLGTKGNLYHWEPGTDIELTQSQQKAYWLHQLNFPPLSNDLKGVVITLKPDVCQKC